MKSLNVFVLFILMTCPNARQEDNVHVTTIKRFINKDYTNTHVELGGTVKYVHREKDGDTHIRIEDSDGMFIIAECIQEIPCQSVRKNDHVTVVGISRYDYKHKWWEIHPVRSLVVDE